MNNKTAINQMSSLCENVKLNRGLIADHLDVAISLSVTIGESLANVDDKLNDIDLNSLVETLNNELRQAQCLNG